MQSCGVGDPRRRFLVRVYLHGIRPNKVRTGVEESSPRMASKRDQIQKLLKGIETGDPEAATVVNEAKYIQHNPRTSEGSEGLADLASSKGMLLIEYQRVHRVLAEGNFVLCMSEGCKAGLHSGIYDLFRITDGKILECWNTVSPIAPRSEWKNENGKF